MAQVWLASGVKPNALIGHSLGEYVAACLAGVFDLETALRLVTVRGRLIWQETRGAMLAVSMTASQLTVLLPSELSLAAVNGPEACVVAGSFEAIDAFEKILEGRNTDFFILMSSSAALLGGLAFTSYTASNAYLDAFAEYANRLSDTHWLSINWDAWEYENSGTIPPQEAAFWMKAAEATEAFHRILLNMPSGRIAVASADLQARYLKWSSPSSSRASDMPLVQHERPNLSTTFSATETALAEICCSLLGYSEIGRSDDFFELGGDSMLGIRMIGAVSQRLGHQLPLTIFLERPTIQSMAQSIGQDPISVIRAKVILDSFLDGMPEYLKNDEIWGWAQYAQG